MEEDKAINYFSRRQQYLDELQERIVSIRSLKEIKGVAFVFSVRSLFLLNAHLGLLLDQMTEAKKSYFKGAKITVETIKIFNEDRYSNLEKKEPVAFTSLFVNSFLDAILSGNDQLLQEYVETIEGDTIPNSGLRFNYEITYAMKYLILGDFKKARSNVQIAHQKKYFSLSYKGFSHVLLGILDNNSLLVNEGIKYRIAHHKKEYKGTVFYNTSDEATALAKLAMKFGCQPDVSSSFIHKDLLSKQEDIVYEGVDDILNSLREANDKKEGLKNIIKRFFRRQ